MKKYISPTLTFEYTIQDTSISSAIIICKDCPELQGKTLGSDLCAPSFHPLATTEYFVIIDGFYHTCAMDGLACGINEK